MRDSRGREIEVGRRAYIRPRPSNLVDGHQLPGVRGEIVRVDGEVVTVREFTSCGWYSAPAEFVRIQYGRSTEQVVASGLVKDAPKPRVQMRRAS